MTSFAILFSKVSYEPSGFYGCQIVCPQYLWSSVEYTISFFECINFENVTLFAIMCHMDFIVVLTTFWQITIYNLIWPLQFEWALSLADETVWWRFWQEGLQSLWASYYGGILGGWTSFFRWREMRKRKMHSLFPSSAK